MTERCYACQKRRKTAMDPGGLDLCSECSAWAAEYDRLAKHEPQGVAPSGESS